MSVADSIQRLIGCGWGRAVSTPDDDTPCEERAVQIVVLHNGPAVCDLRLCARHTELIKELTDPHQGPT